jgi:tripartite-type tricarboxylate transporter receptor subunit TctC
MHMTRRGLGLSLSLLATPALAQAWPERPITLVIPFAPGAFTDNVGRFAAAALSQRLGQNVVPENRPGAGGAIAARHVARTAPDGYTLLLGTQGINASNASLMRNPGYDPTRDFTPIHGLAKLTATLVTNPGRPYRSVADVVEDARRRPGQVSFGSAGIGTVQHLLGEMFQLSAGIRLSHVPYRGGAPAAADLIAGNIDLMFEYPSPGLEMIRAGRTRALAVAAARRMAAQPDIPTMAEAGVPRVTAETWFAVFAPRGLPEDVRRRLDTELAAIVAGPEFREFLARTHADPVPLGGLEFERFVAAETEAWRSFAEATGFRID